MTHESAETIQIKDSDYCYKDPWVAIYKKNNSIVIMMDSCGKKLGDNIGLLLKKNIYCAESQFIRFGNNEINVFPTESVREKKVFIVGTGSNHNGTINDNLMTMCGMIRACQTASAKYITAICTYFPYCRSDKKDQGRAAIMAKLVADFFKVAGANRIITVDLHAAQIQGFFDGPFDNLYAINYLVEKIKLDYPDKKFIVISPDAGGEKRANAWANKLNTSYTFLTKTRDHDAISVIKKHELVHNINFKNETIILVDDIGDTLGTLCSAAKILKERGAKEIIGVVTHGVFSGNAFKNLENGNLDKIYTTNTIPQDQNMDISKKIILVDLSELLAKVIMCCANAESISNIF